MISNNIKRRIEQIKLYDSQGSHTIIDEHDVRILLEQISAKDLADPATTYCDPQCGTATILLVLADKLMTALAKAIPDETKRLEHIFKNQLFAYDIDSTQARVASSNFKRAVHLRDFPVNVFNQDCFTIKQNFTYVISGLDFKTTSDFVPYWRPKAKRVVIVTRPNKTAYSGKQLHELTEYRFLGVAKNALPLAMMVFDSAKKDKKVRFTNDTTSVVIDNPPFLPSNDLTSYAYAHEVIEQGWEGYEANYGPMYSNDERIINNPGRTPLIFQVGAEGEDFREIIKVSSKILTGREGVGKHKIVISKNGNRGRQSVIKYADPTYGTGHNTIWIEVPNKKAADAIIKYWNTDAVRALCQSLSATSPANGVSFWKQIPKLDNYDELVKIYDKYY
jgi:hypothetical protein